MLRNNNKTYLNDIRSSERWVGWCKEDVMTRIVLAKTFNVQYGLANYSWKHVCVVRAWQQRHVQGFEKCWQYSNVKPTSIFHFFLFIANSCLIPQMTGRFSISIINNFVLKYLSVLKTVTSTKRENNKNRRTSVDHVCEMTDRSVRYHWTTRISWSCDRLGYSAFPHNWVCSSQPNRSVGYGPSNP